MTTETKDGGVVGEMVEKLRALAKEPVWTGEIMSQWNAIREYFHEPGDHGGSLPRDIFENIISHFAEACEDAADLLTALVGERDRLKAALEKIAAEEIVSDGSDPMARIASALVERAEIARAALSTEPEAK